MTNLRIADLDRRVEELLTDPDRYFAAARRRAWTTARAEVDADLARRARTRQDHDGADGHHLSPWLLSGTPDPHTAK